MPDERSLECQHCGEIVMERLAAAIRGSEIDLTNATRILNRLEAADSAFADARARLAQISTELDLIERRWERRHAR